MSTETQAPDPAPSMSFSDAVRIASGCKDYGGGYRGTDYFEAYQHGIATVVASLRAAAEKGLQDTQVRALHTIGADSAPAIPAPEGAQVVTDLARKIITSHYTDEPEQESLIDEAWRVLGFDKERTIDRFNDLVEKARMPYAQALDLAISEMGAALAAPAPQDSLDSAQPSKGVAMQAPQAPAWQPIETAPKERGGLVDIICNERRYTGCHYDRICDEYRHITACGVLIRLKGATHWMPIPAAPQTKEPTNDR